MDEGNASYPRFESYDRRMKIRDIAEGIDFEGGFTMQGAKLQGYGTKEEPAFLTFYRDKRPFIITSGLFFSIEPERITSDDVAVRLILDKDSIYHPSVSMRFLKAKKLLTLIKKDEGLGKAPFYDTYHELDMYFETHHMEARRSAGADWVTCKEAHKRVRASRASTTSRRSATSACWASMRSIPWCA